MHFKDHTGAFLQNRIPCEKLVINVTKFEECIHINWIRKELSCCHKLKLSNNHCSLMVYIFNILSYCIDLTKFIVLNIKIFGWNFENWIWKIRFCGKKSVPLLDKTSSAVGVINIEIEPTAHWRSLRFHLKKILL